MKCSELMWGDDEKMQGTCLIAEREAEYAGYDCRHRETDEDTGRRMDRLQLVKYAEDLARIYQEEKTRRRVLERVNEELSREVGARREAEEAVRRARESLEQEVRERTEELRRANELLEREIVHRKLGEVRIRKQLEEKDVLLSEIHHRVKNNLQMICSLLALQSSTVKDRTMLEALNDCACRVRSMALIHEQLYRSNDLARIDMGRYVEALVKALTQACGDEGATLSVRTDVDDAHLSVDSALPCGLIINELVVNCIKHAFLKGEPGEIRVAFKSRSVGGHMLQVRDNGKGMPLDLDWGAASSLGLKLVKRLAEHQLGGHIDVLTTNGTTVTIELPDLT
ncbi:MAG: histidine kinase dimerization/phosphoacceptor domain -containing protein [Desulfomonilaceae bacterium]|nr:histidine kinase dimerization/phosphoacceptor domain -containing protein [Desulfomonilaceae bacterium]